MTLGQLATFLAVARTGSVRAAAAERVVSEPSVSAAVSALERELGVALVERQGRGLRLTAAGATFAQAAAAALAELTRGGEAARAAAGAGSAVLRLAAVTTAGESVVPALLGRFRQGHPEIEVRLQVGNRARVLALLAAREADVAIGGRPPERGAIAGRPAIPNELVVVAARGHRLAGVRRLRAADVADEVWLLREEGSGTRETTLELFARLGISPEHRLTLGSNGAVTQGALAGLGVTLVSKVAVQAELRSGRLRALPLPGLPLRRPWYALTRRGETTPGPGAAAFLSFLPRGRPERA